MFRSPIALVLLLCAAGPADATIYKCTDGKDHIAYQARPCAAHLHSQVMALKAAPAPPAGESPGNDRSDGTGARHSSGDATTGNPSRPARRRAPPGNRSGATGRRLEADTASQSWECRVANGEVFYQHSPCPDRVVAASEQRDSATRGRRRGAAAAAAVSARPLPRSEACLRIHAASASGRAGHERDEDVSTYERNLGRDPCR